MYTRDRGDYYSAGQWYQMFGASGCNNLVIVTQVAHSYLNIWVLLTTILQMTKWLLATLKHRAFPYKKITWPIRCEWLAMSSTEMLLQHNTGQSLLQEVKLFSNGSLQRKIQKHCTLWMSTLNRKYQKMHLLSSQNLILMEVALCGKCDYTKNLSLGQGKGYDGKGFHLCN